MSFSLITDDKGCVVYRKDKVSAAGKSYCQYFTKVSSKDKSGEWQSAFMNLAFKKDVSVNNKAKIKIKNSFPTLNTYNDKTTMSWMVMDFDVLDEGEAPAQPVSIEEATGEGGFMNVPDDMDEVPFL